MQIITNIKSRNYSIRDLNTNIDKIILHYTELDKSESLKRLTKEQYQVSSHYFIDKQGNIYQLVDNIYKAWHAGISFWQEDENINNSSIGIELENLGDEPFSNALLSSCFQLVAKLKRDFNIDTKNIIGHSDIAPNRKIDPGIFFPWYSLYKLLNMPINYKLSSKPKIIYNYGDNNVKDLAQKLAIIGYKSAHLTHFNMEFNYIIRSFFARFYPQKIIYLGVKFYRDENSRYDWCENAELILNMLLTTYYNYPANLKQKAA